MLKNIRISGKLTVVGVLVIAIPLVAITFLATQRSAAATSTVASSQSTLIDQRTLIFVIAAVAIAAAVLVFRALGRSITKQLCRGVEFAEMVASGDFPSELSIHQKDEVGKLASALNAMSKKLRAMVSSIQHSAVLVASSSEQITANAVRPAQGAQD